MAGDAQLHAGIPDRSGEKRPGCNGYWEPRERSLAGDPNDCSLTVGPFGALTVRWAGVHEGHSSC